MVLPDSAYEIYEMLGIRVFFSVFFRLFADEFWGREDRFDRRFDISKARWMLREVEMFLGWRPSHAGGGHRS